MADFWLRKDIQNYTNTDFKYLYAKNCKKNLTYCLLHYFRKQQKKKG